MNFTQAINKNWYVQLGLMVGSEAMPWHLGQTVTNPAPFITSAAYTGPNVLYPGNTFPIDPGSVPTFQGGIRWRSDSGGDAVYVVADGYNAGLWGYNNLQWLGATYYHKFNDAWHITFESYWGHVNAVPNTNNSTALAIMAAGGTPLSSPGPGSPGIGLFNSVSGANCSNTSALTCRANWFTALSYLNYKIDGLNNLSFRAEYFDDEEGYRTGVKTAYLEVGIGWQHWLSPQIEIRPEVSYYNSLNASAFNGNGNANTAGFGGPTGACAQPGAPANPGTNCKNFAIIAESDVIVHF
jgi:hypothetical protein